MYTIELNIKKKLKMRKKYKEEALSLSHSSFFLLSSHTYVVNNQKLFNEYMESHTGTVATQKYTLGLTGKMGS